MNIDIRKFYDTNNEILRQLSLRFSFISKIAKFFYPQFSSCSRCKLTWNLCKLKSVETSNDSGTFSTCKKCWKESTLQELKSYYSATYYKQKRSSNLFGYGMNYTIEHLMECVEKEFNKTHKK